LTYQLNNMGLSMPTSLVFANFTKEVC